MERYSDYQLSEAIVAQVVPESIAAQLGIRPGYTLLAIDGQAVLDVFDYRSRQLAEHMLLLFSDEGGELWEFDLEKDEDEDIGLEFVNPLLSDCSSCDNHCVFCFIEQLPPGMRSSLYFKDDDSRLSFLTGNYVTLSNISDQELERIISYHFSPLNISVHSTDPNLRVRLMGNKKAANIMPRLRRLSEAGIKLNAQFVLCPGLNDGTALEQSLRDLLSEFGHSMLSIAVVPVGLSRWRQHNHLYELSPFDQQGAEATLRIVDKWQAYALRHYARRLVFAADEFYLLADEPLPSVAAYEDFPQLENGVGMLSLFLAEVEEALEQDFSCFAASLSHELCWPNRGLETAGFELTLVTGMLAAPFIRKLKPALEYWCGYKLRVYAIENRLFGARITVTGLLTGQDIVAQLKEQGHSPQAVLLCDSMLRRGEDLFLDDYTLGTLVEELACSVYACQESGSSFMAALRAIAQLELDIDKGEENE